MRKPFLSAGLLTGLAVALLLSTQTAFADDNLVSWWTFDEGAGYTAHDSAGSNDGTVYGPSWTEGKIAGALSFDGSLDYVLVGDRADLEQQEFTLSFWAKLNNPSYSLQGGIAKGFIFGSPTEYSYKIDFDSGYVWPAVTNTANTAFGMSCPIGDDGWHMWTMTARGGMLILYKDGVYAADTEYTGNIDYTKNDNNFAIGARKYGSYAFNGKIDDVRFYDTALSALKIQELYYKAFAPHPVDGATGVNTNVVLSWSPGESAVSHDVYLGTDYDNVDNADTSSPEYKGNLDVNTLDAGELDFFTTYYWRIDERSHYGITKGVVWSFKTCYGDDSVLHVPSEYPTIQAAIDASVNGNTIVVAPGTYTGTGNRDIDFKGKAITVRSIDPENPSIVAATVIDCENSGRGFYFHSGESKNSVVCGLTITRGSATGNPAVGGGIYCGGSSPTIKNCVITNNSANGASHSFGDGESGCGGGVYCTNSHLTLINCEVSGNQAIGGDGGSRYCLYPGCYGTAGSGGYGRGGGIFSSGDSSLTVVGCKISGNSAAGGLGGTQEGSWWAGFNGGEAVGGGICSDGSLFISDCVIAGNRADGGDGGDGGDYAGAGANGCGGGIFCNSSSSVIYNCIITNNWLYGGYGGYNNYGGPDGVGGIAYGAGAYCSSAANISNCTITKNKAYGGGWYNVHSYGDGIIGVGTTTITNCILWGNGDDLSGCSATYSCISDINDGGIGVIHSNPLFVNAVAGDLHLLPGSTCIDAGDNDAVPAGIETDLDGRDRFTDGDCNATVIVDMGAYEFTHAYFGDFDSDCDVDFLDFAIQANFWLTDDLLTDIAPTPAGDGIVDIYDLIVLCDNWLESF